MRVGTGTYLKAEKGRRNVGQEGKLYCSSFSYSLGNVHFHPSTKQQGDNLCLPSELLLKTSHTAQKDTRLVNSLSTSHDL